MVTEKSSLQMTSEEYLSWERKQEFKNEYHDGVVIAMLGANPYHCRIVNNLVGELWSEPNHHEYETFAGMMRVGLPVCNSYYYPDVVVVCGEARFDDAVGDTLLNPSIVFEVTSESTWLTDRVTKRDGYGTLESLSTYILINHEESGVEIWRRRSRHAWLIEFVNGLDAILRLPEIGCELRLSDIYARVSFPSPPNFILNSDANEVASSPASGAS